MNLGCTATNYKDFQVFFLRYWYPICWTINSLRVLSVYRIITGMFMANAKRGTASAIFIASFKCDKGISIKVETEYAKPDVDGSNSVKCERAFKSNGSSRILQGLFGGSWRRLGLLRGVLGPLRGL